MILSDYKSCVSFQPFYKLYLLEIKLDNNVDFDKVIRTVLNVAEVSNSQIIKILEVYEDFKEREEQKSINYFSNQS